MPTYAVTTMTLAGTLVADLPTDGAAFGRKLRDLRTAAGHTQGQFAELIGVHVITVSRMERGVMDPAWSTVERIARVLGVSLDEFRGDEPLLAPTVEPEPPRPMGKRK